jgi:hypothetical protein
MESEPVDDVALDGLGEIVNGFGEVGEAEVDDGCGAGVGVAGPENVRGVEIVVRPQGRKLAKMEAEFLVEGLKKR